MNAQHFLFLLAATASLPCLGQNVQGTIIDLETGKPLRDVEILIDGSYSHKVRTDFKGTFVLPDTLRDVTLMRAGYEYRKLLRAELTDTIGLLPNYNKLHEIVVYGKDPGKHSPVLTLINGQLKAMENLPKGAGISCDLLSWLKVFEKGHVSQKEKQKRLKAIENY